MALYSGEIERHWIEVTQHEVFLPGLAAAFDGFRIAQLSDIHTEDFTEPWLVRTAIDHVNRLQPDAVFFTGDFVTMWSNEQKSKAIAAAWRLGEMLNGLTCNQRYGVLGNHDMVTGPRQIIEALDAFGVTILNNAYLPVERGGSRFWLAGLEDPVVGTPRPEEAVPVAIRHQPQEPVVLLCHGPDYADKLLKQPVGQAVSFMLSGHTHGGQVRMPFAGPILLPPFGKKYVAGWFRLGKLQLYVNRGLGTVALPIRFNCPPEIALFTLRAG